MITKCDLKKARSIAWNVERKNEAIIRLDALVKRTTTHLHFAGGGSTAEQDKMGAYMAKLEEIQKEYRDDALSYERKMLEIDQWICTLPYPLNKIVDWRFIDGDKFIGWDAVGARLYRNPDACRKMLYDLFDTLPE